MKRFLAFSLLSAAILGCSDATPTQTYASSASVSATSGGPPPGRGGPPAGSTSTGYEIVTVEIGGRNVESLETRIPSVSCPTGKRAVNGGIMGFMRPNDDLLRMESDSEPMLITTRGVLLDGGQRWGILPERELLDPIMITHLWAICINS